MNIARRLVSKKKKRYQEGGFDLDLTYVTPNIIAMGFPSVGKEALFRNPMEEVQRMLKRNHGEHYKVYNLCSEKTYEPSSFEGRVERFPFDDHNAPPFEMMLPCCRSMDEWLKQDPRNVAIIHCKAGKGRTGTMICAYLLYNGTHKDPTSSMDFYGESRTRNKEGVTIPSQRRYVEYFSEYVKNGFQYPRPNLTLYLDLMLLFNPPQSILGAGFKMEIRDKDGEVLCSFKYKSKRESESLITIPLQQVKKKIPICGDLKILFYEVNLAKTKLLFHLWLNTQFIPQTNSVTLQKIEIDKIKSKSTFPDDFKLELQFSETPKEDLDKLKSPKKVTNRTNASSTNNLMLDRSSSSSTLDIDETDSSIVIDDDEDEDRTTSLSNNGEIEDEEINDLVDYDSDSSGCEFNDGYQDENDFINQLEQKYNQLKLNC